MCPDRPISGGKPDSPESFESSVSTEKHRERERERYKYIYIYIRYILICTLLLYDIVQFK